MFTHLGKCPHCKRIVDKVILEPVDVEASPGFVGPTYNGVSYSCPFCRAVLSVAIDPVALKADTAVAVVQLLRRG